MNLKDKVTEIGKVSDDVKYLRDEYEQFTLWGSCPNEDVQFDTLMQWLFDNQHNVEHMIKVANKIESLSK